MSRRREFNYVLCFALLLLSIYGMIRWLDRDVPFFLCWLGTCAFSFLSFRLRQVKCPQCGKNIHQYWQHFQYCPYCGDAMNNKL